MQKMINNNETNIYNLFGIDKNIPILSQFSCNWIKDNLLINGTLYIMQLKMGFLENAQSIQNINGINQ